MPVKEQQLHACQGAAATAAIALQPWRRALLAPTVLCCAVLCSARLKPSPGAEAPLPTAPRRAYWLGLKVTSRPDFVWNDPAAASLLEPGAYSHWAQAGGGPSEPDNGQSPPEDCGIAQHAQAYGGAWGWADVNCSLSFISVCKAAGACMCGCVTHEERSSLLWRHEVPCVAAGPA